MYTALTGIADGARNACFIIEPGGWMTREYTPFPLTLKVNAVLPQARLKHYNVLEAP